nr:nucleolar protein 4-like isoform X2 [Lepeophtheirus salmonis]
MLTMMNSGAASSTTPGGREGDSVTSSSSPITVSSTSLSPPPLPLPLLQPPSSSTNSEVKGGYSSTVRQIMLSQYSPWVMSTYGDSAKTKTITARKYSRILGQLRAVAGSGVDKEEGEYSGCEDSKFKLWVKTKGFQVGPPSGHPDALNSPYSELLYIPTGTDKTSDGKVHFVYKKVAMVEQFFDIIYSVHVESAMDTQLRGRSGKHCGQKRTYRAVADQYAFIPREAISKFLLYCVDCQRKNFGESRRLPSIPKKSQMKSSPMEVEDDSTLSPQSEDSNKNSCRNNSSSPEISPTAAAAALSQAVVATMQSFVRSPLIQAHPSILATRAAAALIRSSSSSGSPLLQNAVNNSNPSPTSPIMNNNTIISSSHPSFDKIHSSSGVSDIDLSLPITSTYLRRMRALGIAAGLELQKEAINNECSDITELEDEEEELDAHKEDSEIEEPPFKCSSASSLSNFLSSVKKREEEETRVGKMSQLSTLLSQNGPAINLQVQHQQQTAQLQQGTDGSVNDHVMQDDTSSNGAKDDEDEDDDDDISDDRIEGIICGDPEKLKAFNMFVRLFVDENLDRHVPISKQPKEKIQAIIDSCTRQFPEHACRARKRIRTYLKSCRRTKRTREQAGLDPSNTRPTPPHLTSVQAEQLLARACENEAENAKRMRMGMEPISQPMPIYTTSNDSPIDVVSTVNLTTSTTSTKADHQQQLAATLLAASQGGTGLVEGNSSPVVGPIFPSMNGNTIASVSTTANTATLYRQPFPQGTSVFPTVVSNPPPVLSLQHPHSQPQQTTVVAATTTTTAHPQNGTCNNEGLKKSPLLNHKLNATEMAAVRQLITGYRESAAFLLRSADELEQLLQIQPKL